MLPAAEVTALAAWLDQRRKDADGTKRSVREFFGQFASGEIHGADNPRIDADLAREAERGLI